ncbi:MAG TPA: hypothetical protein VH092_00425 [Urbifossiella sp.]|jgi:hypothetical protein|nr:hypothetical protein [Urbifossiella sp.]
MALAGRSFGLAVATLILGLPLFVLVYLPGLSVAWVAAGTEYGEHIVTVSVSLAVWWAVWAATLAAQEGRRVGTLRRRWALWVGAVVAAAGGTASLWFGSVEPGRTHREWYHRAGRGIGALADKRPPDVPPGQWEFAVGWTRNLHGNCGSTRPAVAAGWREGFVVELERRLAGPVSLADIDWIWDEYAAHTRSGRAYSDRYRPTRADGFRDMPVGCFGTPVK